MFKNKTSIKDKKEKDPIEFSKKMMAFITINAIILLYCSYILAYLNRVQIAEDLSKTVATTIISVCISYFIKSAFEKVNRYGSRINKTTADDNETTVENVTETSETTNDLMYEENIQ